MLKATGAKFIGRSLYMWGGEANLPRNLQRAKPLVAKVHTADPDMILQACIFAVVTKQVERVPVPDWAFKVLGRELDRRNFRYDWPSSLFGQFGHAGVTEVATMLDRKLEQLVAEASR
jgi:hypothetical protein